MTKKYLIWDLPLRIFHWSFAGTVLACWYTAENKEDYIELHIQLGFIALALVLFRLLWGIVGPKHAQFSQFVPSPKMLIYYLKSKNKETPGHNPLGALMVMLMLLLISTQALSGLFINDDVFSSGPYYGSVSENIEKAMRFLHQNTFNVMIAAIVLHISAILLYWIIKKENLILPMLTGKKSTPSIKDGDAIPHSKILLAAIIAILCASFVYWLVVLNVPVIEEFYF